MKKHFFSRHRTAILLSLGLALASAGCGAGTTDGTNIPQETPVSQETTSGAEPSEEIGQADTPSKKDDFYEAINGGLLSQWTIAPDESSTSWFSKLEDENNERIKEIITSASENSSSEKGSDENNIRALYLTGMDQEGRNEGGYGETLSAFFTEIDSAQTVEDLLISSMKFNRDYGLYSLLGLYYSADMADSNKKILGLSAGDTGLSKEIWFSEDPSNQNRISYFQELLEKLCVIGGSSEDKAAEATETVMGIMRELAESSLSLEDANNPEKTYNVYKVSDLDGLFSSRIPLDALQEIYGVSMEEPVIVSDIGAVEKTASFLTEENLPALKEYVKLCACKDLARFLDLDSYNAVMEYSRKSMGQEESQPFEEILVEDIQSLLGFQCGRLYCEQYFSEETKTDVGKIVDQIVEIYKERLASLEWMSQDTRTEAQNKLASLEVRIGHPDTWPQDRYELILDSPEEGGLYIENYLKTAKASSDYMFDTRNEPVDKTLWPDTPQTVNAYYSPQDNSINLLAGILQPPYYDPEASDEENLGGIGTVIGHEITHAFDTTGSQFDAEGNLRDWWTAEDKEHFQTLADEVISYYSHMEIDGKTVNGSQTVSENIADLGAISCITEISEKNGYDLEKVYESYANIWAFKCREEYLSMQIALDTHSPAKIRVNAVLSAQQAFRDLYGIQEGDGMYQEQMPAIW